MSKNGLLEDTELTPLQEKAIFLLASGKNMTDTGKELNTDRATLYLWKRQPEFEAFYNKVRIEYKEQAKNELINLFSEALDTLKACLQSKNENVKLKTAIYILERTRESTFGYTTKEDVERAKEWEWPM